VSTVKSVSKALKVLKALRGHSLSGITITELAKQLDESPSQTYRYLQTLIDSGFANQLDDGKYALGTTLIQIAKAHDTEIQRAQDRIAEIIQRTSIIA
jgi:DNA-binding IclR family transcriptional regulator